MKAQLRLIFAFLWFFWVSVATLVYCALFPTSVNRFKFFARLFSWGTLRIYNIKLRGEGIENASAVAPALLMGNHQHAVDMAVFGSIYQDSTVMIGKHELKYLPIIGWAFWAAGTVMIHRKKRQSAIESMNVCVEKLKQGISVGMMPEGTRNRSYRGLLPLKKGGFHVAIAAQVPIIIYLCTPLHRFMDSKGRLIGDCELTLRILPPVETRGLTSADVDSLLEKVRTLMEQNLDELDRR